jgi:hypothetical protein
MNLNPITVNPNFMPHKFSSNPASLPTVKPRNSFPPNLDRVSFAFAYEKPGYLASNDQYLLAPTDCKTVTTAPAEIELPAEYDFFDDEMTDLRMENSLLELSTD